MIESNKWVICENIAFDAEFWYLKRKFKITSRIREWSAIKVKWSANNADLFITRVVSRKILLIHLNLVAYNSQRTLKNFQHILNIFSQFII